MVEILQHAIPYDAMASPALPGVQPLEQDGWILVDEAYSAQMQRRAALLAEQRDDVVYLDEAARPAAVELLEAVLALLAGRFSDRFVVNGDRVRRPDGAEIALDQTDPLGTLGHLVQEDFCILQNRGAEHVMTAAVLCFPAGWRLSEKAGRPLGDIHTPVDSYDSSMARRVQRLFDGVQPGRPMWRFNALWYKDPELHQPRLPPVPGPGDRNSATCSYLRSERQCILRLPRTGAAVFSIHSFVVRSRLNPG